MRTKQHGFSVPVRFIWMAALAVCVLLPEMAAAQQPAITPNEAISPREQANILRGIARYFGSAPENPGPKANLSTSINPVDVRRAMRKVANWELAQAQPYFGRNWTWGALYAGFMAASPALNDPRYRDAMEAMAKSFDWQLESAVPDANDQALGQTYLEFYLRDHKPQQMQPTQEALDKLLSGATVRIPAKQAQIPWWWCDSLFMAPPTWARMYAATHDAKYLKYMNEHWWQTSNTLYDTHWHLYHRDITYLHAKAENGQPVFWSRGQGWVMAGLARVLEYLPASNPDHARYEAQLRQMAAAVAKAQDPKSGMWHSSLLDAKDYPLPETSGSSLMTYALAWGVNHGVLSRAKYEPVIRRAWAGLVHQIYADGRLGCVQQTGAAPAHYLPSSSYNYGVGGFLLAGSEVIQISQHAGKS